MLHAEDDNDDLLEGIFRPVKKSKYSAPILSDDKAAMVNELDQVNSLDDIIEEDKSDQNKEPSSDASEAGDDMVEFVGQQDNSLSFEDNGVRVCLILDFPSDAFL